MASGAQELPPPGGYENINWAKKIPKNRWGGYKSFAVFIGLSALAWVDYFIQDRKRFRKDLELREAYIAIEPLILAERQRFYLKQLRANRDEENELMKNVKGWTTGTLWGEPIYHNIRDRELIPSPYEYFAHSKKEDMIAAWKEKLYR